MLKIKNIILALILFSIVNITVAFSDEASKTGETLDPILEEIRWLQAESIVTITTRHEIPISKAPGIVTVITAKQIKQMGFRTLVDFLKTVPGFDITMDELGERNVIARGVGFGEKVKILIDGHSVNAPWGGSVYFTFYDLVVENIKRIEIIRGPGSALYGQNAFLGVVNVVTKDTEDLDGLQLTATGGSFDTQNYNILLGKEYGDLKISGFIDYFDTEGHSRTIERDILFPASFSKSPGSSQNKKEKTDLNIKISYKNLELKSKYMKKRREGYVGVGNALNDDTDLDHTYFFSELVYKLALSEKLNMITKGYYDQYNYDTVLSPFPNGFTRPFTGIGLVTFPNGITGHTQFKQHTIGIDNQFNYNVFDGNKLTFGFQYEWIKQRDVKFSTNFHPLFFVDPTTGAPFTSTRDFTHTLPVTRDATRQIYSFYLQDEWNITKDIDLTMGVRYDHFTRFGSTTNPRLGLVWRFMEDAHLKFLFATAYRAPSFGEMFIINNPVQVGNTHLDPEKVNTYEVDLGYNFSKHIRGNIDCFYSRIRDRIALDTSTTPDKTQNMGGARVLGVETEIKVDFGKENYVYANYTYQDVQDTDRDRLPFVPIHKANFGINIGLWKYVNANMHTFISGRRPRESGDARGSLPSYALVNLSFIGKNFLDNFEVRGSVLNLLDKDYNDPSDIGTVSSDFPQQGRSFMIELRYKY